ncbi:unnamed protein product [Spirodela intermedia]|uniref:Uncharacterized protein n=1 Tax=Spirodela intermedia TaxID=51605 RepID=A0A7I8K0J2_SPIIN|nr:unnamed protein product [Spirodela intermedia]
MAEDQSVVGRRQIYYDPCGSETLICSDSEEDIAETDGEKHDFSKGEDHMLWKAIQQHGLNEEVLSQLGQFIDANSTEIQERYENLLDKYNDGDEKSESSGVAEPEIKPFLYKTLSAALDSFDNIFCRRCLIFDCRLHGCSQTPFIPSEKLSFSKPDENVNPCGDQCYMKVSTPETPVDSEASLKSLGKRKVGGEFTTRSTESPPRNSPGYSEKKQKNVPVSDIVSLVGEDVQNRNLADSNDPHKEGGSLQEFRLRDRSSSEMAGNAQTKDKFDGNSEENDDNMDTLEDAVRDTDERSSVKSCDSRQRHMMEHGASNISEAPPLKSSIKEGSSQNWNSMEKDLYLKGIEIFGKNSCLIARNLLPGLKTCEEVSTYMLSDGAATPIKPVMMNSGGEDSGADPDYMEQEIPARTRIWHRNRRSRKLKYTWKSAGHPSSRKRLIDGKSQSCKQYTPCGCQPTCGKQCPCLLNGTCCEKYCACSKCCKNRFRGCHCAKSQCRSRQCPCFAGGRECDPDVCRNCWVSCGGGSLGGPPARGDGYECGNMNLLLKKKQRILLSKSDVAGWGAFIKNPVNKNDYLGEYTGELISHREADKRGKIYDRANSSFLFDLNDQYVLDAYRKGDKLKFANHSSNPNCYAKVMLVAGDHRVGIFAKERIEVGEELFYDYRYGPDQAPAWARKPEGSKRDDSSVSHGRAQKIA